MVGASFGIQAGPGVIFAGIRYAVDFRDTCARITSVDGFSVSGFTAEDYFTRGKLPLTIGYETGLMSKGDSFSGGRRR
jgi:hypothetical protein